MPSSYMGCTPNSADPGTGKTWSARQLTFFAADMKEGPPLVPLLMTVQDLAAKQATRITKGLEGQSVRQNVVRTYIREVCDEPGSKYDRHLLLAAYELRLLLLVVDGIDEAPQMRASIEELLLLLAGVGMRIVATSRPEGVDQKRWAKDFVLINLKPLTDDQQEQMISNQVVLHAHNTYRSRVRSRFGIRPSFLTLSCLPSGS